APACSAPTAACTPPPGRSPPPVPTGSSRGPRPGTRPTCTRSRPRWSPRRPGARRPAAATGGRTFPTGATSAGTGTCWRSSASTGCSPRPTRRRDERAGDKRARRLPGRAGDGRVRRLPGGKGECDGSPGERGRGECDGSPGERGVSELDPAYVDDLVRRALAEDLAGGVDVTSTATVPADQTAVGDLVARADGVVAGLPVAAAVFAAVDPRVVVEPAVRDGDRVRRGAVLATVTGPTRSLLTAERTALNLLCHLSGVATATARWVDAVSSSAAAIRDTRKTTPGLRALEKYAVRRGGGRNHRMSL